MISEEKQVIVNQINSLAINIEQDGIKLKQYAENITTDEQIASLKEAIVELKKQISTVFSSIEKLAKQL
ncbi:hypothetical protein KY310_04515 [Candidatus Woesearchaeota archaeon]|nr:hypothetical protein [Candidatus Woesearchaeota archaeon]